MTADEQTRRDLLAALGQLGQLGRLRPDWRVGQTLANLAMTAGRVDAGGVWDLEDGEALAAARRLIGQHPAAPDAEPGAAADPAGRFPRPTAPRARRQVSWVVRPKAAAEAPSQAPGRGALRRAGRPGTLPVVADARDTRRPIRG